MQEQDVLQTARGDSPAHEEPSNIIAHTSAATYSAAASSTISGLYLWKPSYAVSSPVPHAPDPPAEPSNGASSGSTPVVNEELRLDVDGRYPQMVASGVIHGGIFSRVHWIANLVPKGTNFWAGDVFYKEGNLSSFPYRARFLNLPASFALARQVIMPSASIQSGSSNIAFG
jgi:hypothetical protein